MRNSEATTNSWLIDPTKHVCRYFLWCVYLLYISLATYVTWMSFLLHLTYIHIVRKNRVSLQASAQKRVVSIKGACTTYDSWSLSMFIPRFWMGCESKVQDFAMPMKLKSGMVSPKCPCTHEVARKISLHTGTAWSFD